MGNTIIRAQRSSEKPYFSTSRAAAQNKDLTFEARGMLWYLLSKPDDWSVNIADLQQQCGRDKVYRLLAELRTAGYLSRTEQIQREDGTFSKVVYTVREEPLPEKPYTVQPYTENQDALQKKEDKGQTTEKASVFNDKAVENGVIPAPEQETAPAEPEPVKVQPHIALIDAYWSGLPGGQPIGEDYPRHVKLASKAVEAVTPYQIQQFMAALYDPATDIFEYKRWHHKVIPFEDVLKLILPWLKEHPAMVAPDPNAPKRPIIILPHAETLEERMARAAKIREEWAANKEARLAQEKLRGR